MIPAPHYDRAPSIIAMVLILGTIVVMTAYAAAWVHP